MNIFKDGKGKTRSLKKRGSLKSMYDDQAGNISAINEYAWKDLRYKYMSMYTV